jgi:hypothetical protein
LFSSPLAALEDPWIQFFVKLTMTIAVACLPVLITYQAVRRMLESLDGTNATPPEVLVRRSLNAGVAVTGVALFGWLAGTFADYARELLGAMPVKFSFLETFFIGPNATSGLAGLLLMMVFLIGAGLVVIQRAILGAEFAVLMIIGAFLGLQKVGEDRPHGWQLWKREVVAVCITPVLQLLLIYLFAIRVMGQAHPDPFTGAANIDLGSWVDAFAMLYLLWNMPRWARQFTYSTGVGHTLAGGVAGVTRLAVFRMMLKR